MVKNLVIYGGYLRMKMQSITAHHQLAPLQAVDWIIYSWRLLF